MKLYKIQERAVQLPGGSRVDLSYAQASTRAHLLEGGIREHGKKRDRREVYVVLDTVHFKVGEVFGWDGEVPKSWADNMIDLEAVKAAEAAAAQAEIDRAAEGVRNKLLSQQRDELVAALAGVQGDADGNITEAELRVAIAGKVNFDPTPEQLEAAWAALAV